MKKASIIMAFLAFAIIAGAYTNSVPISANTRAATEKWTAIRFEPALPPTPANAESKFLNGNREWQTVASAQPQSVVSVNGQTGAVSITAASLGALTAELDPVANAALAVHTNRTDNPHGVTAADVGAVASSGDFYMPLSDGVTTFSVFTELEPRIALESFDQALYVYRNGTVALFDYEGGRGVREFSLFDVPTYTDTLSIVVPMYESGTNITVTSTQSVYSVAVTGAGPVGIDWSGLALDGTGRAEVTLRLNVTEWGGTNVTFSPSLTFDQTPEILVTGVWEFAASTIDGVTTLVRQTWPEAREWRALKYMDGGQFDAIYGFWNFNSLATTNSISFYNEFGLGHVLVKSVFRRSGNNGTGTFAITQVYRRDTAFNAADIEDTVFAAPGAGGTHETMTTAILFQDSKKIGFAIWILGSPETVYVGQVPYSLNQYRKLNSNERAAYEAGWRP